MIDNLEKSKEKMEDYNKQLEKDVVDRTKEINKAKVILEDYNGQLEKDVADRTKELSSKVDELERLNNLGVGRELKMLELKERIKELESLLKEHEIKT
jgi:chromosome segregation ATPase